MGRFGFLGSWVTLCASVFLTLGSSIITCIMLKLTLIGCRRLFAKPNEDPWIEFAFSLILLLRLSGFSRLLRLFSWRSFNVSTIQHNRRTVFSHSVEGRLSHFRSCFMRRNFYLTSGMQIEYFELRFALSLRLRHRAPIRVIVCLNSLLRLSLVGLSWVSLVDDFFNTANLMVCYCSWFRVAWLQISENNFNLEFLLDGDATPNGTHWFPGDFHKPCLILIRKTMPSAEMASLEWNLGRFTSWSLLFQRQEQRFGSLPGTRLDLYHLK